MIIIDYKDTRPIYEQIVEKFKTLILKGALRADEQMPSVRNLAMDLSINPNTIQKAYAELERQGYIYSVKGRGNFVSNNELLLERRRAACREAVMEKVLEALEYGVEADEILDMIQHIKQDESRGGAENGGPGKDRGGAENGGLGKDRGSAENGRNQNADERGEES